MKQCLVFILSVCLCQMSFAITCPTVSDIQKNTLAGWKAYDSDEGEPLSAMREAAFKKNAREFALAEWVNKGDKMGSIHCYYRDDNGSAMEAYLAKEHFRPKNPNAFWYEVSGFMQCAAGMENCDFEQHQPKTHLAKK